MGAARRLCLVQHGEALSEAEHPERPLSAAGRADVEALADVLALAAPLRPERVLHSGKRRARETAELIAARLGIGALEEAGVLAPRGDPREAARLLEAGGDLLAVTHMPLVASLAAHLLGGAELAFRPGTAACLERDEAGRWRLVWLLPPEVLRRR